MADSFNDFFEQSSGWVDDGAAPAPVSGALPPQPPRSRRDMRRRREQRKRRHIIGIIAVIVVVALVVAGGAFGVVKIRQWRVAQEAAAQRAVVEDWAGPGEGEVSFTVEQWQAGDVIAKNLVKAGIVKSVEAFTSAAGDTILYPGTYSLKKKMSAESVVKILADQTQATGFLEVRPGDRVSDVLATASQLTGIAQSDFEAVVNGGGSGILPAEAGGDFEGWLEPGSYDAKAKTSASEVLKEMVDARIAKLDEMGVPSGDERERILKIASIAEAEVNRHEYYGKVTRVIENRLEGGMNLGMDTSLAYGLGKKASEITDADIADTSNPYNLHNHEGLPPSPISNPGDEAIQAAQNPEPGDWMYFVTVDLSTGETKFVETEDEFWQIRQEYKDNNENAN